MLAFRNVHLKVKVNTSDQTHHSPDKFQDMSENIYQLKKKRFMKQSKIFL